MPSLSSRTITALLAGWVVSFASPCWASAAAQVIRLKSETPSEEQAQLCSEERIATYVEKLGTAELSNFDFDALVGCGVQAVPAVTQALRNDRSEVRASAAYTLGQIGADAYAAVPALTFRLRDEYADVRALAAFALGQIGSQAEAAIPQLINASGRDEDSEVRQLAMQALEQIGTEAATSALASLEQTPPQGDTQIWDNLQYLDPTDSAPEIQGRVQARVSTNLPFICRLPRISSVLPRCR